MKKPGCKIICGAPKTLAVKGLMMMVMMMMMMMMMMMRAPGSRSKGCEFESRQERREKFLLQS